MIHLWREIEDLKKNIMSLAMSVESMLKEATQAVENRDSDLAQQIIHKDNDIDSREVEIEEDCLKMFALYQPVANDLRFIVGMLKINNDLERMGDMAVNLSKNAIYMSEYSKPELNPHFNFEEISTKALEMVRLSLDAMFNQDVKLAVDVCKMDDVLDDMVRNMITYLKNEMTKNPSYIGVLLRYINIFRYFERIGDLATNIAEDTIYMVDGKIVRHGAF